MAKHTLNRLSAKEAATQKKAGRYRDGGGLILVVTPAKKRKWVFRYDLNGKRTDLGLGSANDVSLADARESAAGYRAILARGGNSKADHRKAVVPTFAEFAEQHIDTMQAQWRSAKHRQQWRWSLMKDAAVLAKRQIDEIGTEDVLAASAARLAGVNGHRSFRNCGHPIFPS